MNDVVVISDATGKWVEVYNVLGWKPDRPNEEFTTLRAEFEVPGVGRTTTKEYLKGTDKNFFVTSLSLIQGR